MRPSPQRISSSLYRCVHTSSPALAQSSPRRPAQRHFHRASTLQLPRRRSFFTSNVLLNQDGSETPGNDKAAGPQSPSKSPSDQLPSTAKRKPRAAAKNSLRRVAQKAMQTGAPGTSQQPTTTSPTAEPAAGSDGSNMIHAVCAAEAFDMDKVMDILTSHGFQLDPDGTGFESHEVVHARGVGKGDVFVFESGTIVTWSLPPDVVGRLATRLLLPASEDPFPTRLEKEDLEFALDPTRETSGMKGDVVVLGTLRADALATTLAKIAFSSGLARSTKLAALESSFTSYFESTRRIPAMLADGKRLTLSRRFILQKTGELLSLRAQLNHYRELTDSLPDIFWDSRYELGLENYYDQVGKALDAGVRIRTLNEKMTYAQEIVTVLREISSEKHGTRLEWIIILLIAVEVVFELRRWYLEREPEQEVVNKQ